MSKLRVLLTGATGFVGSHVHPFLLERNYDVIGGTRQPDKARAHAPDKAFCHIDLEDAASVYRAFEGIDRVVYLVHSMTENKKYEGIEKKNAETVRAAAERIVREVPGATLSDDSIGRSTDIAIDHAEFRHLGAAAIERVRAVMHDEGMTATVSSIHVNGCFGAHNKLTGATWIVRRLFGRDLDAERDRWLYVGDSTNDELMFKSFALSVGVANIADFADRLRHWPAYVTALDRGRGFIEVAESLLAARGR